jgi:hypothetical protein
MNLNANLTESEIKDAIVIYLAGKGYIADLKNVYLSHNSGDIPYGNSSITASISNVTSKDK